MGVGRSRLRRETTVERLDDGSGGRSSRSRHGRHGSRGGNCHYDGSRSGSGRRVGCRDDVNADALGGRRDRGGEVDGTGQVAYDRHHGHAHGHVDAHDHHRDDGRGHAYGDDGGGGGGEQLGVVDAAVLHKLAVGFGKSTQEVGYQTDGHLCVTRSDVNEARRTGGSLLYGEVLPRGVAKMLDRYHLNAARAETLFDLGAGTGKLALQAFVSYPGLRRVVGVELCFSRYSIGELALRRLVAVSDGEYELAGWHKGRSIKIVATKGNRELELRRGNLLDAHDASDADIVILETDMPPVTHGRMCQLLASVKATAHVLTYLNLREVWTLKHFPLEQLAINRSGHDRFLTSWSFTHGHHFYLWHSLGAQARTRAEAEAAELVALECCCGITAEGTALETRAGIPYEAMKLAAEEEAAAAAAAAADSAVAGAAEAAAAAAAASAAPATAHGSAAAAAGTASDRAGAESGADAATAAAAAAAAAGAAPSGAAGAGMRRDAARPAGLAADGASASSTSGSEDADGEAPASGAGSPVAAAPAADAGSLVSGDGSGADDDASGGADGCAAELAMSLPGTLMEDGKRRPLPARVTDGVDGAYDADVVAVGAGGAMAPRGGSGVAVTADTARVAAPQVGEAGPRAHHGDGDGDGDDKGGLGAVAALSGSGGVGREREELRGAATRVGGVDDDADRGVDTPLSAPTASSTSASSRGGNAERGGSGDAEVPSCGVSDDGTGSSVVHASSASSASCGAGSGGPASTSSDASYHGEGEGEGEGEGQGDADGSASVDPAAVGSRPHSGCETERSLEARLGLKLRGVDQSRGARGVAVRSGSSTTSGSGEHDGDAGGLDDDADGSYSRAGGSSCAMTPQGSQSHRSAAGSSRGSRRQQRRRGGADLADVGAGRDIGDGDGDGGGDGDGDGDDGRSELSCGGELGMRVSGGVDAAGMGDDTDTDVGPVMLAMGLLPDGSTDTTAMACVNNDIDEVNAQRARGVVGDTGDGPVLAKATAGAKPAKPASPNSGATVAAGAAGTGGGGGRIGSSVKNLVSGAFSNRARVHVAP